MVAAVRVHQTGGPEVMKYEDVPVKEPGQGEIKIKQTAIGLNFIDTYFRSGLYPAPHLPFVAGNEGAGVVTAVGPGVKGIKKGDRVAYVYTLGAYAAERILPAERAVKLPPKIDDQTGAAMMLKGMTAQYLLHRTYKVKKGDTILVHAAAGGVGLILCQWGKALGATVIGTAGSKEKAELARKNGAHHTILYNEENWVARVAEITKGKKCDVVYDGVGKATFMGSLDCLRPLGMMVIYGNASGPVDALNTGLLAQKGSLFLTRPTLMTYTANAKDLQTTAKSLIDAVLKKKVKIEVNQTYALKDAVQAHRDLESRKTTGQTVLIP
ncbi:MAG TPA: quinone oxidoreductase [Xanthobacteraceae bacterium]|jgi:NADPH:quinone reductase|nr:quinone oxidoreductase [Xanthobacteraceae bacterium]